MSHLPVEPMELFTASFTVFFLIIGLSYWLVAPRLRQPILVIGCIVFYMTWDPRLLALLLIATAINHLIVLRLLPDPPSATPNRLKNRKLLLRAGIVVQCGLLFSFKYFGFFLDNLRALAGLWGTDIAPLTLHIAVPLGLSYFCLKAIAILADTYQNRLLTPPSLSEHIIYLLFFPSITAGPIDRPRPFIAQLAPETRPNVRESLRRGGDLIFIGCLKKFIIANHLAGITDQAFSGLFSNSGTAVLAAVTYAFYLYADFSGYTDIARGIAACLGIKLMENFRRPYGARSPSEFWQRWHISLSSWLRDYVFLPLGGAFRSRARAYANLLVTMAVAGIWHGASWMFVLWGLYIGSLLVMHRVLQPYLKRLKKVVRLRGHARRIVETGLTFFLISAGWLLFRGASVEQVASAFTAGAGDLAITWRPFLFPAAPLIALCVLIDMVTGQGDEPSLLTNGSIPWWIKPVVFSIGVYGIFILGTRMTSFVYAQF